MSFQKLLQDTIYNALFANISSYIYECRESLDVSTYLIQKPKYIRLDDFTIKSIPVSNKDEDFIVSDLLVIGYLEIAGYSKYGYEKDSAEIWLSVRVRYLLENGLHQLSIIRIKPYDTSDDKGSIPYFTKEFIPYVSSKNIDKIAEDILEEYYPEMLQAPMALPIYDFARNIGGEVEERTLPQ